MKIDIRGKGIPEAGIPPLDRTDNSEIPAVARKVIDYIRNQAIEEGLDIGRDYKRGREYQLRMVLERTAQFLNFAYSDIASTDTRVFQQFDESLDEIIGLLQTGTLVENSKKRKESIRGYREKFLSVEETIKSLAGALYS